jgi:hypothetical protein
MRDHCPEFSTCSRDLTLPIWPEEESAEGFNYMMNETVAANLTAMTLH